MVDGATFENIIVSNVVIRDAHTPLFLRLGNRGRGQKTPTPGVLRNVMFSNIVATGGTLASSITGLAGHPATDITLSDIDITMAGGETQAPAAIGGDPCAENLVGERLDGQPEREASVHFMVKMPAARERRHVVRREGLDAHE